MTPDRPVSVAIVDYGLGNIFSVQHACEHVGMRASLTNDAMALEAADGIILPGVGAFGDAMNALERLDLIGPLRAAAAAGRAVIGICLGLQLLMDQSTEFGRHDGLGILAGTAERLPATDGQGRTVKVPHVGWNGLRSGATVEPGETQSPAAWRGTPLAGQRDDESFYFVHSYYVVPADPAVVLSHTTYADTLFCSAVHQRNVFACQFHPERSGPAGLRLYKQLSQFVAATCGR